MSLQELRQNLAGLTQSDLAELMKVTQGAISQLEKRRAVLLSKLAEYIHALGGELELIARFPIRGLCELPKVKCGECPNQAFFPFDDATILGRLTGGIPPARTPRGGFANLSALPLQYEARRQGIRRFIGRELLTPRDRLSELWP